MIKKLWILLVLATIVSLCIGRYEISWIETGKALFYQGTAIHNALIWNLRLPRILFVICSGVALAVSGCIFQTIFRNPLASGDIIGASSGCSLGAAVMLLLSASGWLVEVSAFFGGIVFVFLALFLAHTQKDKSMLSFVLAGFIVQAIGTSLLMMIKLLADPYQQLASIEYWLMGGFQTIGWEELWMSGSIIIITTWLLYRRRWYIQMLCFGEEASTLGVSYAKTRIFGIICATLLVSSVVSVAGLVSWVGLLIPHVVRLFYPRQMSQSFMVIGISGALFLLLCDTLSRSLFMIELPISILTSLFGAGILFILFMKGRLTLR